MKKTNKLIIKAALYLSILVLLSMPLSAVRIDPPQTPRDFTSDGVYFHNSNGNAYFATAQVLNFSQIVLDADYVQFNDTRFYITSPNRINISLSYLIANMSQPANGTLVCDFYANTTTGNVWFNITSYLAFGNYLVERDAALLKMTYTDEDNYTNMSFDSDTW